MEQLVITKKIAKHGSQSVIVVPRVLESALAPSTQVIVNIEILNSGDLSASGKSFTIEKKIAKHGSQSLIIVPRALENELKPRTIVRMAINVLKNEVQENGRA